MLLNPDDFSSGTNIRYIHEQSIPHVVIFHAKQSMTGPDLYDPGFYVWSILCIMKYVSFMDLFYDNTFSKCIQKSFMVIIPSFEW